MDGGSSETTAMLALLELPDIKGRVAVAEAMHARRPTAETAGGARGSGE